MHSQAWTVLPRRCLVCLEEPTGNSLIVKYAAIIPLKEAVSTDNLSPYCDFTFSATLLHMSCLCARNAQTVGILFISSRLCVQCGCVGDGKSAAL